MTDYELGAQHGRLGLESRYPNNVNYIRGFKAGTDYLMRELNATRPFEQNAYPGTNDAHFDQHYA